MNLNSISSVSLLFSQATQKGSCPVIFIVICTSGGTRGYEFVWVFSSSYSLKKVLGSLVNCIPSLYYTEKSPDYSDLVLTTRSVHAQDASGQHARERDEISTTTVIAPEDSKLGRTHLHRRPMLWLPE